MDEVLLANLEILREIDRRLEDDILPLTKNVSGDLYKAWQAVCALRSDMAVWIKNAKDEYDAF